MNGKQNIPMHKITRPGFRRMRNTSITQLGGGAFGLNKGEKDSCYCRKSVRNRIDFNKSNSYIGVVHTHTF